MNAPAVSVVVPVFNAEKYFAECLDSLLNQTFQDFEVVVVDDCSTDSSVEIAESFLEKFGGRLTIYDNEKNSGPSVSRNKGLNVARGEYIFSLDADDLILPDGLENLFNLAKTFDVDVVSCTGHYDLSDDGSEKILRRLKRPTATDENIFENNFEWRVEGLLVDNFYWAPWRRLSRRKFLIDNGLFFKEGLDHYEDLLWTFEILLCAEKILHTPLIAYVYRKSAGSLGRQERTPLQDINLFINFIFQGIGRLDALMNKIPFFEKNPNYRFEILMHFAKRYFDLIYKVDPDVPQDELYHSIKEEFGKNFGEYDVLFSVLCALLNEYQKDLKNAEVRIKKLEKNLKQREKS